MIMLCFLLALATPPADAAQMLLPALPEATHLCFIDRAAAVMTADRFTWLVWYQSPGRSAGLHEHGHDTLELSEGVYCTLVDSLGLQALAPFRVASPSSLRAAECWGGDPLLTEALATPDGRLLLLMREKTAEGYGTGYTYDLTGPDYVHPVGRVAESTRVVVVSRNGSVRSSVISVHGEEYAFSPSTSSKQEWTYWDSSGRLHLFAVSREYGKGPGNVIHAVISLVANRTKLVSLDSVFVLDTTAQKQWHLLSQLDWIHGAGDRSAVAVTRGDTAFVATLQAGTSHRRFAGPVDSLRLVHIHGRTFKPISRLVVPVAEIAGKDYDTYGPQRAVLLKTQSGFVFFCNYQERLATFYLDAAGNPISGPRSPATIVDGPTAGVPVTHVIELPWAASGLAPGERTVIWYGLTSNGDVYRSIAGDLPPSRPLWQD